MSDDMGADPVDSVVEEAVAVAAAVAEANARAATPPEPATPAIGDAVAVGGRSGTVFGVCTRDGRVYVTLGPSEDWLALA